MYISEQLRKKNIAEYLLYMWQVEDVIRAYRLDIDEISEKYIPRFQLEPEKAVELINWYENLITMMYDEGVEESGHLQINRNVVILLNDLHMQLLKSPKYPFYSAQYYKALPFIVELRQAKKNKGEGEKSEIETCFDALYLVMLMRAQKKEVAAETATAIDNISKLLAMLSEYYKQDKNNELEL
ncbi:MAG: DUF4924 family protein [Bacteroidaceae bacterium]|nr:DUF4924 family protein [Bacteroidaceae bacterium]MBP5523621.1 DUF4924 family protein [Bacteroidaceae bacterium]MBQ4379701.1 DUF4924 family protein [Bacteroidaceae bacterium]